MAAKSAAMLSKTSILGYFADVEDQRKDKNRKHPLIYIIGIAILEVICGMISKRGC
jgi:hypothetical protein